MIRFAAILFALAFASPAWAAAINGPTSVPQGRLVRLSLTDAADVKSAVWRAFPVGECDLERTSATSCVLTGKPGRYEIWCVWNATDGTLGDAVHVVTIEGSAPGPSPPGPNPPGPTPPVPPTPVVDRWGLIKIARETAPSNAGEKAKLRANYSAVASQLAAGGFSGVPAARDKLRELNRAAVGNPAVDGHPWNKFAFATAGRMDEEVNAGRLQVTPADYSQAYGDIARGLE